jgi:hypothetical protein
MDRRHHKRFELEAVTRFTWKNAEGVRCHGQGLTRDISETGVFIVTSKCPPSGAAVRLQVRASALSTSGLMMQTSGQVVRVEQTERPRPAAGFAAATRSLKLRDFKPAVIARGPKFHPGAQSPTQSWSHPSRKPN